MNKLLETRVKRLLYLLRHDAPKMVLRLELRGITELINVDWSKNKKVA